MQADACYGKYFYNVITLCDRKLNFGERMNYFDNVQNSVKRFVLILQYQWNFRNLYKLLMLLLIKTACNFKRKYVFKNIVYYVSAASYFQF